MKIDYKKEYKELYKISPGKFAVIEVPDFNYLVIYGKGDPSTSEHYKNCVEAMYILSSNIKMIVNKGEIGIDYGLMPLEGIYWTDDVSGFNHENKESWKWKLMVMQPHVVNESATNQGFKQTRAKCKLTEVDEIKLESFNEGFCAHTIHIGPLENVSSTLDTLNQYIKREELQAKGKYHEVYLSDLRKTIPEKLRTLIRQPIDEPPISLEL